MKQRAIILFSLLIILILLAIFVFLLVNKNGDAPLFPNFPGGADDPGGTVIEPTPPPPPPVNLVRPRLRQLTTRPVIEFKEVANASTGQIIINYVEAGKGHVYSIDLNTGVEERLSNTTVKEAAEASLSLNSRLVAIKSNNQRRAGPLKLVDLDEPNEAFKITTIDAPVLQFSLLNNQELIYTERTEAGLRGTVYNIVNQTKREVFTLPFFEVNFRWGTTSQAKHYLVNKPTFALESYLYSTQNNRLNRLPVAGFGLGSILTENYIFYSYNLSGRIFNQAVARESNQIHDIGVRVIPEKCVASLLSGDKAWCGYDPNTPIFGFPDDWYRGSISFRDTIWELNGVGQSNLNLVDTFTESGRDIDIIQMGIGESETALYFINKNDNTLWMYELYE